MFSFTRRTPARLFTFAAELGPEDIKVGIAVCRFANGETGEILEEVNKPLGRRLACARLESNPIVIPIEEFVEETHRAFVDGSKPTARRLVVSTITSNEMVKAACRSRGPAEPIEDVQALFADNFYKKLIEEAREANVPDSESVEIECAQAWKQREEEIEMDGYIQPSI